MQISCNWRWGRKAASWSFCATKAHSASHAEAVDRNKERDSTRRRLGNTSGSSYEIQSRFDNLQSIESILPITYNLIF